MAYMNQERKAQIAPAVKAILKKYHVRGSLSVRNHMVLVLNIKSGIIDFVNNFHDTVGGQDRANTQGTARFKFVEVNPYHYHNHFSGQALKCVDELMQAMMTGNHDRSDIQSDYFDVGWYVDINIGSWNRPYEVEALIK
jgi:hypothetical protein